MGWRDILDLPDHGALAPEPENATPLKPTHPVRQQYFSRSKSKSAVRYGSPVRTRRR